MTTASLSWRRHWKVPLYCIVIVGALFYEVCDMWMWNETFWPQQVISIQGISQNPCQCVYINRPAVLIINQVWEGPFSRQNWVRQSGPDCHIVVTQECLECCNKGVLWPHQLLLSTGVSQRVTIKLFLLCTVAIDKYWDRIWLVRSIGL